VYVFIEMSLDSRFGNLKRAESVETDAKYPFEAPAHQTEGQVDIVRENDSHLEHFNVAGTPEDLPRTFSRLAEARKYRDPDLEGIILLEEDALNEIRHLNSVLNESVPKNEFIERYEDSEYWTCLIDSGVIAEYPEGNYSFTERMDKLYHPEEVEFQL